MIRALALAAILACAAAPSFGQAPPAPDASPRGETPGLDPLNRNLEAISRSLASIDRQLGELQRIATQQAERDLERLRAERTALDRLLQGSQGLDRTVARERAAVDEIVLRERSRLVEFLDLQRAALTADGERIARDMSSLWLDRAHAIVRDAVIVLLLVLLAIVAASIGIGWTIARIAQRRRSAP